MKPREKMLKDVVNRIEPEPALRAKVMRAAENGGQNGRSQGRHPVLKHMLQAAAALVLLAAAVVYGPKLLDKLLVPVEPERNPALVRSSAQTEDMPKFMVLLVPDTDVWQEYLPAACLVAMDEENRQIKEISFVREVMMSAVSPLYPFGGQGAPEEIEGFLDVTQQQWESYTGQKLSGVFLIPQSSLLATANMLYPLDIVVSEEEYSLMSEITGYFSGTLEPYELMDYLFISPSRKVTLEEQLNDYRILCGQQEKTITAFIRKILQGAQDMDMDAQFGVLQSLLGDGYHNLDMSTDEILSYLAGHLDEWDRDYEVVSMQSPNDLSGFGELAQGESTDSVALELLRQSWNKEIDSFLAGKISSASSSESKVGDRTEVR